jgi:DNA-binding LacI/PurR family transcriptional regulator
VSDPSDFVPVPVPKGISQREIAERSGVSIATVSRALSGSSAVSPRTRAQILSAVRSLESEGNGTSGRQIETRTIGLTNSHLVSNPYSPGNETMVQEILGGVEEAAQIRDCVVYTLHQSGFLLDQRRDAFFSAIDGLLLTGGVISPELAEAVRRRGIACVLIGGHLPDSTFPSVCGDVARGTYLCVQHLAELGHRKIALVNGPTDTYTSIERRAGYLEAMFDAGLPVEREWICWREGYEGFSAQVGKDTTTELLNLDERPTAIVYASDTLALGGLGVLSEAGLRVPDDVSITGFDDARIATAMNPQLTTIKVDRVAWGTRALERLLRILDETNRPQPERLLMPVELTIRASTAPAPSEV